VAAQAVASDREALTGSRVPLARSCAYQRSMSSICPNAQPKCRISMAFVAWLSRAASSMTSVERKEMTSSPARAPVIGSSFRRWKSVAEKPLRVLAHWSRTRQLAAKVRARGSGKAEAWLFPRPSAEIGS